jgi:AP-2 complex subunit alpha
MPQVQQLLAAVEAPHFVRKKSSLALLRLFRAAPFECPQPFCLAVVQCIMHEDLGVVMSVASLIIAMALHNPEMWVGCVPVVVNRLHRLTMASEPTQQMGTGVLRQDSEYMYYQIPAPWLCVKLLRLLQIFDESTDGTYKERLKETLTTIITRAAPPTAGAGAKPKAQYTNANQAIFFEAVNLVAHYDSDSAMQLSCAKQCGNFFQDKAPNVRSLALEGLSQMALTQFARPAVKEHLPGVLAVLHDSADVSLQKRAVDVLYGVCDDTIVKDIVKDLLRFLKGSDYGVREEVVLKCAILAEKFAVDHKWYVNVVLTLIQLAGDHVAEEVWHRVLQVVVNKQDVQSHAARTVYQAMIDPSVHEAMIKVGAYILGEFGHLIANDPSSTPQLQLDLLKRHYPMTSIPTRALILTTYVKFTNVFPELKTAVQDIFRADNIFKSSHSEIQQRANEYFNLTTIADPKVPQIVLEEMPVYTDGESGLVKALGKGKEVTDKIGGGKKKGGAAAAASTAADDGYQDETPPASPSQVESGPTLLNNLDMLAAFQTTDSGKLFENHVLQVGAKLEVSPTPGTQHKARLTLFYGNKGQVNITGLSSKLYMSHTQDALTMTAQELPPSFLPSAQVPQVLTFDCMMPYAVLPMLVVTMTFEGKEIVLELTLPIPLNRFCAPHATFPWDSAAFMGKWNLFPTGEAVEKLLGAPEFTPASVVEALTAFKLTNMPNIDPNPGNMCCAAMLHCAGAQVGVLVRVQTVAEKSAIMYTVRASNPEFAPGIAKLLASMPV